MTEIEQQIHEITRAHAEGRLTISRDTFVPGEAQRMVVTVTPPPKPKTRGEKTFTAETLTLFIHDERGRTRFGYTMTSPVIAEFAAIKSAAALDSACAAAIRDFAEKVKAEYMVRNKLEADTWQLSHIRDSFAAVLKQLGI